MYESVHEGSWINIHQGTYYIWTHLFLLQTLHLSVAGKQALKKGDNIIPALIIINDKKPNL